MIARRDGKLVVLLIWAVMGTVIAAVLGVVLASTPPVVPTVYIEEIDDWWDGMTRYTQFCTRDGEDVEIERMQFEWRRALTVPAALVDAIFTDSLGCEILAVCDAYQVGNVTLLRNHHPMLDDWWTVVVGASNYRVDDSG